MWCSGDHTFALQLERKEKNVRKMKEATLFLFMFVALHVRRSFRHLLKCLPLLRNIISKWSGRYFPGCNSVPLLYSTLSSGDRFTVHII